MDRKGEHFVSKDTLDLGMSLWTAHWLAKQETWAAKMADQCTQQMRTKCACALPTKADNQAGALFEKDGYLQLSTRYRLAFRDFGTCLGVGCYGNDDYLQDWVGEIISFWEKHMSQTAGDLRPITQVMYAAALIPGGQFTHSIASATTANVPQLSKRATLLSRHQCKSTYKFPALLVRLDSGVACSFGSSLGVIFTLACPLFCRAEAALNKNAGSVDRCSFRNWMRKETG